MPNNAYGQELKCRAIFYLEKEKDKKPYFDAYSREKDRIKKSIDHFSDRKKLTAKVKLDTKQSNLVGIKAPVKAKKTVKSDSTEPNSDLDAVIDFYLVDDYLVDREGKFVENMEKPYSVSKIPKNKFGKELLSKIEGEKDSVPDQFKEFYTQNKDEIDLKIGISMAKKAEIKENKVKKFKPKPGFSKADEYISTISSYFLIEDQGKRILIDKKGQPVSQFDTEMVLITPIEDVPHGDKLMKEYKSKEIQDTEQFSKLYEDNNPAVKKGLTDAQTLKDLYMKVNKGSGVKQAKPAEKKDKPAEKKETKKTPKQAETTKTVKKQTKPSKLSKRKSTQFELVNDEDFEALIDFYIFDDVNRGSLLVSKEGKLVKNLPTGSKIAEMPDSPLGKRLSTLVEQEIEQIEDLTGFEDFFKENTAGIEAELKETEKMMRKLSVSRQKSANLMENLKKVNPSVDFSKIDYFVVPSKDKKLIYDRNGTLVKDIEKEDYYIFEFDQDFKPLSKEITDEDFEEIEALEDFYMFYENESAKIKENIKKTKEEFFAFDITNKDSDEKVENRGSVAFEEIDDLEDMQDFYLFEADEGKKIIVDKEGNPVDKKKSNIFTVKGPNLIRFE